MRAVAGLLPWMSNGTCATCVTGQPVSAPLSKSPTIPVPYATLVCHVQKALRRTSSWDPPIVQSQPLSRAASDFVAPAAAAAVSSSSGSPERATRMDPCQE